MRLFFYHLVDQIKNSPARRDRFIFISLVLSILLNVATWVLLYWQLRNIVGMYGITREIPLHYNVLWGIDLLGPSYYALIMPLIGSVTILLNTFMATALYTKKFLASYILMATALLVQAILAVATMMVILLNI